MEVEVKYRPSGTIAICRLTEGEELVSEGGALVALKGKVGLKTTTRAKGGGGIIKGIKRLFSGESFFLNRYTALENKGEVWLSGPLPGDIMVRSLNGEKLIIQGGGYMASAPGVEIDLEWQGLKSIFSGHSIFWVKAKGVGEVLLTAFGLVYEIQVDGEYIVDTGHILAFEESLDFTITKASRTWFGALLSGEGFICRFRGRGKVWCVSHSAQAFGQSLRPHLRARKG